MANNRFVWSGLDELRAALRRLPVELATDARGIVLEHANAAAGTVRSNYESHRHTGDLASSVVVKVLPADASGVRVEVKATSPHAHLFEFGTAARQNGQGQYRGVMPAAPPAHAFIPAVMAERRQMYDDLIAVLKRAGLEVSGSVD